MFCFVILNYNTCDLTIECINKIRKIKTDKNVKVIVVDNATLTDKEIKKIKKYCDDLIINEENLGFAKANNIGINLAKTKYRADFVCELNSDCFIEQKEFINLIYEIYDKNHFDMLGPKIDSDIHYSWNPFYVYTELSDLKARIKYQEKLLKIYNSKFLYFLLKCYLKLKINKTIPDRNGTEESFDAPLHGCCIIFSKQYLKKYDTAFYDKTFLFHEEEFLYYRVKKDGLVSMYSPLLCVSHLEGMSTKTSFENERKRLIFRTEGILKSLYMLKDVIEADEKI